MSLQTQEHTRVWSGDFYEKWNISQAASCTVPPPFGVKSHARGGRQVMWTTKLKDLTPSVKIPDFHQLKTVTFWVNYTLEMSDKYDVPVLT